MKSAGRATGTGALLFITLKTTRGAFATGFAATVSFCFFAITEPPDLFIKYAVRNFLLGEE